jgi:hypothetical protein
VDKTPRIWAADIGITPDGRFLYTTERTNSTISLLSIAPETGKLSCIPRRSSRVGSGLIRQAGFSSLLERSPTRSLYSESMEEPAR